MTLRLVLVRHGRVDFDATDFIETVRGRQWDPPLGAQGREQAGRLARRLAQTPPPARIWVSPFRRCLETLQPYLDQAGVTLPKPEVVEDLGEVYIGTWEGMRFEDIVGEDKELARRFRDQDAMFSLAPGGESGEQLRRRVVPAVERGLDGVDEGSVLMVTHGGVINAYLGHVMGITRDMFFLPDNASVNTVDVQGDRREVWFLNDSRHLTDPGVFIPSGPIATGREGPATTES
jgi:broad specificity phosphatase PhoE